jgi:hypothetical protein
MIHRLRPLSRLLGLILPLLSLASGAAQGQGGREFVRAADATTVAGKIRPGAPGRFQFAPEGGGDPWPLEQVGPVYFEGAAADPSAAAPPFHVALGNGNRISGSLRAVTPETIDLETAAGRPPLSIQRAGAQALVQRPGEVQAARDAFEMLDEKRWSAVGEPVIAPFPDGAGTAGLKLPAGGAAVTYKLAEGLGSGRFEIVYHDDGKIVAGQHWFVDLTFRGPMGLEPVQALLGWDEETLAVVSRGGPALAVQPLRRKAGRHRLSIRFGPGHTDLTVDGDELAHGDGPGGPLVEIRLATESLPRAESSPGLAAYLDDLRLVRFTEPAGRMEIDPSQDEARLITGDQLFGRLISGDPDHLLFEIADVRANLNWSEVSGVFLKRSPQSSEPLSGLWVRPEWQVGGGEPAERDRVEGVLADIRDSSLQVAVPYAGLVEVPRDRLKRLDIFGRGKRIVIEPNPHHLGNRAADDLDPPRPEGPTLDIPFSLKTVPAGAAVLLLDVVQVIGETGNLDFSDLVKQGELRTVVLMNGRPFDTLNRHINTRNDVPARIRLPIPSGALKAGDNVLRFEQSGMKDDPRVLDNLGILNMVVEFPEDSRKDEGPRP